MNWLEGDGKHREGRRSQFVGAGFTDNVSKETNNLTKPALLGELFPLASCQQSNLLQFNLDLLSIVVDTIIRLRANEVSLSSTNRHCDRNHFKRCLNRLEQNVLRMGALVENSFRLGHQALFYQNLEAIEAITSIEKQIDRYYRHIEIECASLLTLQSPVAQDLRLVSAFMQLIRDLERIGDYAEDLTEISVKLFAYPPHPCMSQIEEMSHHAQAMLATSLASLADLDATAGQAVKVLDDKVDNAYDNLYQTLAYQRDIKGVVEPILLLVLTIRHIERMADHATNIGQRVTYIVTGHRS